MVNVINTISTLFEQKIYLISELTVLNYTAHNPGERFNHKSCCYHGNINLIKKKDI